MRLKKALLAAGLVLFALTIRPAGQATAQEPALRRDVPPLVPGGCGQVTTALRQVVAQDAGQAAQLVNAAREAALLGDPDGARGLLERAALADPTAANVAFLLARTLVELGDTDNAVLEYCRYLRLAPNAPDAADVQQTVRRLAPPVRVGISDSAVARFHEALAFADSGRIADAELAFSDVIVAAPTWSAPHYNRALLRVRLARRADARDDLERFLYLEPQDPDESLVRDWVIQLSIPFRKYSPGSAFALGLMPGIGHYYTGRPVAGTVLFAVAGGAAAFGAFYQKTEVQCLTVPVNGVCPPDQIRTQTTERPYLLHAVGAAAAVAMFSAIDAARGARRHNERATSLGAATDIGPSLHVRHARVELELLRVRF